MRMTVIVLRAPLALAVPGWRGGPAPLASLTLGYVLIGRAGAIRSPAAHNDNDCGAAA